MKKRRELPPRVYEHGRWYCLVTAEGSKRIWTKLTLVKDGIPALYRKLADLEAKEIAPDAMGNVVSEWLKDVSSTHSKKTQANEDYMCREIAAGMVEFRAGEITPPDIADFLRPLRPRPRTHNAYRSQLRELMRYAEERGWRPAGSNPVESIRTMHVAARTRYITDSELRRIKRAAMVGEDKKRTRSGPMICALVDMAYLTGQRISDLLALQWSQVTNDGILFAPAKVSKSTGAQVLISFTPRLRELVQRLRGLAKPRQEGKVERLEDFKRRARGHVFTTQQGRPYTYYGASTAWMRAVKRAGIENCHFHDLRAKALTDKVDVEGMQAARRMSTHTTETQLADYVRNKKALETGATR